MSSGGDQYFVGKIKHVESERTQGGHTEAGDTVLGLSGYIAVGQVEPTWIGSWHATRLGGIARKEFDEVSD